MSASAGGSYGGVGVMKKGPWSAGEDAILVDYVNKYGEGNWNAVQRNTGLRRCGKSCRLRWVNHLRPDLKKGPFSLEEERLIVELHTNLGNKWAGISSHLPGRTDNEVKNFWNTRVKKRMRLGLPLYPHDPQTRLSTSPPPPPPPPPHLSASSIPLSLLDPIASCHLSINPPSMLPRTTPLLGQSFSSQLGSTGQPFQQQNGIGLDFQLSSVDRIQMETNHKFDPCGSASFDFELPSNQIFQNMPDEAMDEVIPDQSRGNNYTSGLLDALLIEARDKGERKKMKKMGDVQCEDAMWENSSSDNGYAGKLNKEEEDDQVNSGKDDLSSILSLIPSLVRAPEWCNANGEASAGQSSVVTDENVGLEMPYFASFPALDANEDNWKNGPYYFWDYMPGIY